ncbi:MAG: aldo/keto reductase [Pseudomonadota bacterium]
MQRKELGKTGIEVSVLCLGSMTWGSQNSEAEGHAQIDMSLDHDVDFIDTAEMYPVNPVKAETIGRTEEIIGNWIGKTGRRKDIVLATKHSGAGLQVVRDGEEISSKSIPHVIEGSLKRLQTDYIDLYQFHWPNRGSYAFRQNWRYDPRAQNKGETLAHMEDTLGALQKEVDRGTIRSFGLSNESAWGTSQWLRISEVGTGPRVASVQNEYSLLHRLYDTDMAELGFNEEVDLLAFSPLATGLLTGKYQGGAVPQGSRMSLNENMGGRNTPRAMTAVDAYVEVANRFGLNVTQMALAWCLRRPFPCIPIFGATSLEQLKVALGAGDVSLSDEVLDALDETHKAYPMPY